MAIILVPQPGSTPSDLTDWEDSVETLKQYNLGVNSPVDYDFTDDTIKKGVLITIGGSNYYCNADTAITGTASDYVKITSAGIASYVTDLTGVSWNDTYNFYSDVTGNAYIFNEAKAGLANTAIGAFAKEAFCEKVLIGTTVDAGYSLDVNGTVRIQGNTLISDVDFVNIENKAAFTNVLATIVPSMKINSFCKVFSDSGVAVFGHINSSNVGDAGFFQDSTLSSYVNCALGGSVSIREANADMVSFKNASTDFSNNINPTTTPTEVTTPTLTDGATYTFPRGVFSILGYLSFGSGTLVLEKIINGAWRGIDSVSSAGAFMLSDSVFSTGSNLRIRMSGTDSGYAVYSKS